MRADQQSRIFSQVPIFGLRLFQSELRSSSHTRVICCSKSSWERRHLPQWP